MSLKTVTDFANANRVAYMATMDADNQPRVRAFDMWKADETGFYFHNNATKGVYDQLRANPKVELFFPSPDGHIALRVLGTAHLSSDMVEEYYGTTGKDKFRRADGFNDAMIHVTGKAWFRSEKGKRGKPFPIDEVVFPAR